MGILHLAGPSKSDADRKRKSLVGRTAGVLPGIIAGAADLDPAAVLTATVAGASFGYSLGWVVLLCVPVLFSVFAVSSRIGNETRKGLVELVRANYGKRRALFIALLIVGVNFAMILGDIVAVSDGFSLITIFPRSYFMALVGFLIWYVLILGSYQKTTKALGALTLILIAYVVAAWHVTDSFKLLAQGVFLPRIQPNTAYMMGVVAVFGSLLTPDVIVWQTSSRRGVPEGLAEAHVSESHAGTIVACLISLSAMIAASHLRVPDPTTMTPRAASEALGTFGFLGPILFSLGIIGSGLVALPILVASLCFSVAEAFGWKSGLSTEPWEARLYYVMISVTVFLAVSIGFVGINTVKVLYWSQALAGVVLVPIFAAILLLSNNTRIMHTTNTRFENFWLGCAAGGMLISNVLFFWFLL
ncbi:MAG TPA: divalent metal cation transporter [Candidatus Angelobacter sp.]|nr:divalent metal cation transporter [Candidatus Angelobacter sp.]